MAGRGPAPKPVLQRESRTQARNDAATKLSADGDLRGPDLPEGAWHPRTLEWWNTWRRSAQAQVMTPTDWDVLMETALLHTELWNGDTKAAAELRLRVAKFGATVEDRLRLKIQVEAEVKQAATPAPAAKADRRKRLLKAVTDGAA
jgi:hypothetical protein